MIEAADAVGESVAEPRGRNSIVARNGSEGNRVVVSRHGWANEFDGTFPIVKGSAIVIVVSNRLQVAKGHEADFEKRFAGRARLVENMPGFVRLEILRPVKSDYYIVLTHWQDEASFRAWTDSEEFKEAHRNRPPSEIFAGPNVFEMHEVIQHAGKS